MRLVRAKEIFFIRDGRKHSIPNWDTFLAMKLDMAKVISLEAVEYEEIPLGETLPAMDNRRTVRHRRRA